MSESNAGEPEPEESAETDTADREDQDGTDEDALSDMLESASGGSRIETEPTADTGTNVDLPTAVAEALDEIDAGDTPPTISIRDDRLAALLQGLEATGRTDEVAETLADELDRDLDDPSRSDVVRLAIRYALAETHPDVIDDASEGFKEHLQRQADEF